MKSTKPKPLTEEMQKCLDIILDKGSIFRHKGGFWAAADDPLAERIRQHPEDRIRCEDGYCHYPKHYIAAGTIKALERRGLIEPSEYRTGLNPNNKWAIRYALRSS